MSADDQLPEVNLDRNQLYREETFSDRRAGTITRLTPVTADGASDASRDVLYIGQAQIMTPAGALPLSFQLEASSLDQAIDQFADAAKVAMKDTVEELKSLQREQSSGIQIPGGGGGYGGQGGMPGGGSAGGGNIFQP